MADNIHEIQEWRASLAAASGGEAAIADNIREWRAFLDEFAKTAPAEQGALARRVFEDLEPEFLRGLPLPRLKKYEDLPDVSPAPVLTFSWSRPIFYFEICVLSDDRIERFKSWVGQPTASGSEEPELYSKERLLQELADFPCNK